MKLPTRASQGLAYTLFAHREALVGNSTLYWVSPVCRRLTHLYAAHEHEACMENPRIGSNTVYIYCMGKLQNNYRVINCLDPSFSSPLFSSIVPFSHEALQSQFQVTSSEQE